MAMAKYAQLVVRTAEKHRHKAQSAAHWYMQGGIIHRVRSLYYVLYCIVLYLLCILYYFPLVEYTIFGLYYVLYSILLYYVFIMYYVLFHPALTP